MMKKTLKKFFATLLTTITICSSSKVTIISNTLVNQNNSYINTHINNETSLLLIEPYTDDKKLQLNSIKNSVEKHYNNIQLLQGSRRNYFKEISSYTNNNDIVVIFTHGDTGQFNLFKNGAPACVRSEEIKNLAVKKDSIYIIAACKVSENDTNLAKNLIKNGAQAVYTYSNNVTQESAENQIEIILKNLKLNKTPEQSYKEAIKGFKNRNGLTLTTK